MESSPVEMTKVKSRSIREGHVNKGFMATV